MSDFFLWNFSEKSSRNFSRNSSERFFKRCNFRCFFFTKILILSEMKYDSIHSGIFSGIPQEYAQEILQEVPPRVSPIVPTEILPGKAMNLFRLSFRVFFSRNLCINIRVLQFFQVFFKHSLKKSSRIFLFFPQVFLHFFSQQFEDFRTCIRNFSENPFRGIFRSLQTSPEKLIEEYLRRFLKHIFPWDYMQSSPICRK